MGHAKILTPFLYVSEPLAGAFGFNQRYGAMPPMMIAVFPKTLWEKIVVLGN